MIFDQYTENQLSVAADEYPDLLCSRLYEVNPLRRFGQTVVRHEDWTGRQELSDSYVVTLTKLDFPAPTAQFRGLSEEQLTEIAYAAATIIKPQERMAGPLLLL